VDGIDFDVAPGEAFGFLGPNGAGKTSTIADDRDRVAGDGRRADRIRSRPEPPGAKIRARLGVVPQADTLDNELSVLENLLIYGRYFDLSWQSRGAGRPSCSIFVQLTERSNDKVEPLPAE